jgi:hypothetical protein
MRSHDLGITAQAFSFPVVRDPEFVDFEAALEADKNAI